MTKSPFAQRIRSPRVHDDKGSRLPFTHGTLFRSVWGLKYEGELDYLHRYVRMLGKKIEEVPYTDSGTPVCRPSGQPRILLRPNLSARDSQARLRTHPPNCPPTFVSRRLSDRRTTSVPGGVWPRCTAGRHSVSARIRRAPALRESAGFLRAGQWFRCWHL